MSVKLTNVEAILAVDSLNGLAKNGSIPWKSKTDLTFFRNKTLQNTVIMGMKTFLSLPNVQPLKNRVNFVITNKPEKYSNIYKDVFFVSFEQVLQIIESNPQNKYFIIGGNQIYKLLLPYCTFLGSHKKHTLAYFLEASKLYKKYIPLNTY